MLGVLCKNNMSLRVDYIGAKWCKVCVTVKPAIEKMAKDFGVTLALYDADDMGDDSPSKVPTVRLFKDDVLVREIVTKHIDSLQDLLTVEKGLVMNDEF
jgi:thiol-disulfide isomerase/thioredoxin